VLTTFCPYMVLLTVCVLSCAAVVTLAVGITADNAYAGLAGQYIVRDCGSDTENGYMPHDR
jgi:hypothetical protein